MTYRFRFLSLCIFCIMLLAGAACSTQPAGDAPLYITGGHYFDVHSQQMVENTGIVVRDGRFETVGAGQGPGGARHIELSDSQYLLPGIVDVHAHYRMRAFGSDSLRWTDEFRYNALVYLANGVTSTFPAGVYYPYLEQAASRRVEAGMWDGPRMWTSGPYFGTARPGWDADKTREEIYAEVDYWVSQGVDGFKAKGASPTTIEHLVERAHEHNLPVAGHLGSGAGNSTNAVEAIESGIDRVEHILGGYVLDRERSAYPVWNEVDTTSQSFKRTVQMYLDNEVFFDATMIAPVYFTTLKPGFEYWKPEREMFTDYVRGLVDDGGDREASGLMDGLYNAMQRSTKAFYDAGGGDLITLGTDAPSHGHFLAGFGAHREMQTMSLAGIPNAAVLKIATLNSARSMRLDDRIGSIEEGKWADAFVVEGNPLDDITNTRNVQTVIKGGVTYNPGDLLERVKGQIGPADSSETETWFRYPGLSQTADSLERSRGG